MFHASEAASIETSCECFEGRPGSGKSFICTDKMREFIVRHRRPVFTNLPVNHRVFRQYLRNRGGDNLSRLLYPLTEAHFRSFLLRADKRAEWIANAKARADTEGVRFSRKAALASFLQVHGPNVLRGEHANWITPGSLICIDECHLWFPQSDQKRGEIPQLLRYLTMYRHFKHTIWYVSQDRMQVSLSFRRQTAWFWHVAQASEEKLGVAGIRGKHLGMYAFRYEKFSPESEEALGGEAAEPVERFWKFYWLPWERWKFRLYRSFTHAGSLQALERELREMREELGINEVPKVLRKDDPTVKWYYAALLCMGAILLGGLLGRSITPKPKEEPAAAPVAVLKDAAGEPVESSRWWEGIEIGMLSTDAVALNKRRVKVGESFGGPDGQSIRVVRVDRKSRRVYVVVDGRVWRWVRGDPGPTPLGTTARLFEVMGKARSASDPAP